jgi:hypothetical protein
MPTAAQLHRQTDEDDSHPRQAFDDWLGWHGAPAQVYRQTNENNGQGQICDDSPGWPCAHAAAFRLVLVWLNVLMLTRRKLMTNAMVPFPCRL